MPSLTKRKIQRDRKGDEESSRLVQPVDGKAKAEEIRKTLYKQLRDTDFLNNQWRVSRPDHY